MELTMALPETDLMQTNSAQIVQTVTTPSGATTYQIYDGARAAVNVLNEQMEGLRSTRNDITSQLTNDETKGADRAGLETRLKVVDARIAEVDGLTAKAQNAEAVAAAAPLATIAPQMPRRPGPPGEAYGVAAFGIFVLGFPIAFAYARRIWRRSANTTVTLPPEMARRMQAMEEAIESIAVEVERVGEGQRFMTAALSEPGRVLGAGPAQPVGVRPREAAPYERLHSTPV
jgi:hypothetical protein